MSTKLDRLTFMIRTSTNVLSFILLDPVWIQSVFEVLENTIVL
jgi:hypothetical protein